MNNGKRTGKYSSRNTGKVNRRSGRMVAMLLALVVLLGLSVGGTVAFLASESDSVTNQFIPAEVVIDIDESVNQLTNEKTKVEIVNNSNIPVYIRVTLVGNWEDDGKICINHSNEQPSFNLGTDWLLGDDGYFYYAKPVQVGGNTTDLLGSSIELAVADDGCTYQVEVIASGIQSKPASTFNSVWGENAGITANDTALSKG